MMKFDKNRIKYGVCPKGNCNNQLPIYCVQSLYVIRSCPYDECKGTNCMFYHGDRIPDIKEYCLNKQRERERERKYQEARYQQARYQQAQRERERERERERKYQEAQNSIGIMLKDIPCCPYSIFNVAVLTDINSIKPIWREMVLKYHPDKQTGEQSTTFDIKTINNAWSILNDVDEKNRYDDLLNVIKKVGPTAYVA